MNFSRPEGSEGYRTTPELARWLGVNVRTVYRWHAKGKIRHTLTMSDGTRLWSPESCSEAMSYRISQLPSERNKAKKIRRRIT